MARDQGQSRGAGTLIHHNGNFNFQQQNIFGFKFAHSGQIHFGWARMRAKVQLYQGYKRTQITVLGFGYESTPNTAINAGSCTGTPAQSANTTQKAQRGEPSQPSNDAELGRLALGHSE